MPPWFRAPLLAPVGSAGVREGGEGQAGLVGEQRVGLGASERGKAFHVHPTVSSEDFVKGQLKP